MLCLVVGSEATVAPTSWAISTTLAVGVGTGEWGVCWLNSHLRSADLVCWKGPPVVAAAECTSGGGGVRCSPATTQSYFTLPLWMRQRCGTAGVKTGRRAGGDRCDVWSGTLVTTP